MCAFLSQNCALWDMRLVHRGYGTGALWNLCSTAVASFSWHSLRWRHNDHDSVSDHQPHGCLLNCLFRRRSKKTSKFRVTGLCVGNSPGPVNSPHKWPVTRKMFPFDDVIMCLQLFIHALTSMLVSSVFTCIRIPMWWVGTRISSQIRRLC